MTNIYIKTDFYENSNYLPHILEHCVRNQCFKNYINHWDAKIYWWITNFEVPENIILDKFIEDMLKPLDKRIIKYEKKVIKQDLKIRWYSHKIQQKLGIMLYGKSFWKKHNYKYSDILNYQKRYYKKEKVVILNDNYDLIYPKKIIAPITNNCKLNETQLIKLKLKWFCNKIIYIKAQNRKDNFYIFFINRLIENIIIYKNRFENWLYYREDSSFLRIIDYICISIPVENNIDIDEEYFNKFKKYFIDISVNKELKEQSVFCYLLFQQYPSISKITKFIQNITYNQIKNTLQQKI